MTDRAISEAAMLASLRDIRLPEIAAGGTLAEVAAVIGLASVAALLLVGVIRLLSREKQPQATGSETGLAALAHLTGAERRVALLHLLRARAPERFAAIKGEIYTPGGGIDLETLEHEVRRCA
ncbi:hypothetical protein [uncultured Roseobacter sp.]|uniref:hypothetical protein n=1 Tax=uncultured Roseobacter sp. TaxID=114847 RepID=UPI00262528A7|nr:hypothetical protein [uncultured Roseobacter sp.]